MYSVHTVSCPLTHSPTVPSVQCTWGVLPTHPLFSLSLVYNVHKVSYPLVHYPHYPWCTVYTRCLAHSPTIPLFLVYTVLNVSCPLTQYPKYPWCTVYTRCLSHSPTIPSIPSVRCIQGGLPTHPLSPLSLMYSVHKVSCPLTRFTTIPSVSSKLIHWDKVYFSIRFRKLAVAFLMNQTLIYM